MFVSSIYSCYFYHTNSYVPISVISFASADPHSSQRKPLTILPSDNSTSPIQSGFLICPKMLRHSQPAVHRYQLRSQRLFYRHTPSPVFRYRIQTVQPVMWCGVYTFPIGSPKLCQLAFQWKSFLCSPHTANGILCVFKNCSAVPRISPS